MDRRTFIARMVGSVLSAPLAAAAQAGKVYRVGLLWDSPAMFPDAIEAFHRGLRDLGWVEGQNIVVEYRWGEGRHDRLHDLAEELVRLKVDVIVAGGSFYTEAAKRATSTIPIIFVSHADPIGSGHVASLARPGANITGVALMMTEYKRQRPGAAQAGRPWALARCCYLGPSHAFAWTGLESRRGRGPGTGLPASTGGCAQRDGVRQRLLGHCSRTRRRASGAFNPHIHCRGKAARGTRDNAQTAFDVWAETPRGGRGPHELLA